MVNSSFTIFFSEISVDKAIPDTLYGHFVEANFIFWVENRGREKKKKKLLVLLFILNLQSRPRVLSFPDVQILREPGYNCQISVSANYYETLVASSVN